MSDEKKSVNGVDSDKNIYKYSAEELKRRRKKLAEIANSLEEEREIKITPLSDEGIIFSILIKIPFVLSLLNRMKTFTNSAYTLAVLRKDTIEFQELPPPPVISTTPGLWEAFKNLGLIAAIANFLTVPLIFLAARIANKPSPITLTRFGEWVYSGVLLVLTIISIAVPITAPVIGLILAGAGFVYSIYLLRKFRNGERDARQKIPHLECEIEDLNESITSARLQMKLIHSKIERATEEELERYEAQLQEHSHSLEEKYDTLTKLANEKIHLEQELKTYNHLSWLDNSVGFATAAVFMVGSIVAIFMPPIGLAIATTAVFLGTGYALSRVAISAVTALHDFIKSHFRKKAIHVLDVNNDSSSSIMMSELSGTDANVKSPALPLKSPVHSEWKTKTENTVEESIQQTASDKPSVK